VKVRVSHSDSAAVHREQTHLEKQASHNYMPAATLILFNQPFRVLRQFTDSRGRAALKDYLPQTDIYPAGRLDYDSEGLLLLTNSGKLQARITQPNTRTWKRYLVQVEGLATPQQLQQLQRGVILKDRMTRPARAWIIKKPSLWPRTPPIRYRQHVPTQWLCLEITEGRNRQVRRMCAAVGLPVLRLVRSAVGDWELGNLEPGQFRQLRVHVPGRACRDSGTGVTSSHGGRRRH